MQKSSQWLASVPWKSVLEMNDALCQTQKTAHQPNPKTHQSTRQLWEKNLSQSLSLAAALDICRQCQERAPFLFNNANTFATLGKAFVEEFANSLPSVEAEILRNTIGHYIAGIATRKELASVLAYFETRFKTASFLKPAPVPAQANVDPRFPMSASQATGALAE